MPYLLIKDNKLLSIFANEQEGMNLVFVENTPELPPSNFHSFSIEKGWYLDKENEQLLQEETKQRNIEINKVHLNELILAAEIIRNDIRDRIMVGDGTTELQKKLKSYIEYVDLLKTIDLSVPEVNWPALPE